MSDIHSFAIPSQSPQIQDSHSIPNPKILLVCIINYKRINITFVYLYKIFLPYGEVKKILFFEKTLTWKAFVEMGNSSEANKAKNALNNISLFNDGSKLNIYLSNLKELVLPKNMMNGKDFTTYEPVVNSLNDLAESDKFMNLFQPISLQNIKHMDENPYFNAFRPINSNVNEKSNSEAKINLATIGETDEHLFNKNNKLLLREHSLDEIIAKSAGAQMLTLAEPPGLARSINYQKQKVLKSAELSKRSSVFNNISSPFLDSTTLPTPVSLKSPVFMNNMNSDNSTPMSESNKFGNNYASNTNVFAGEASKVLFVKGLEDSRIKVQIIYNLFSNFGNVNKIIFMRNKSGALIEFQSVEYATIAKDFLNNLNFFSHYLRISYSNYQEIVLKNANFGALKEDILICDENLMRFQKNKNILINPPSNVIHLSNLTREACDEQKIRDLLQGIGEIEKIKFLIQDNQKNMCLVKFSKLEESLLAISLKHNSELEGRAIKISFTKTKI